MQKRTLRRKPLTMPFEVLLSAEQQMNLLFFTPPSPFGQEMETQFETTLSVPTENPYSPAVVPVQRWARNRRR